MTTDKIGSASKKAFFRARSVKKDSRHLWIGVKGEILTEQRKRLGDLFRQNGAIVRRAFYRLERSSRRSDKIRFYKTLRTKKFPISLDMIPAAIEAVLENLERETRQVEMCKWPLSSEGLALCTAMIDLLRSFVPLNNSLSINVTPYSYESLCQTLDRSIAEWAFNANLCNFGFKLMNADPNPTNAILHAILSKHTDRLVDCIDSRCLDTLQLHTIVIAIDSLIRATAETKNLKSAECIPLISHEYITLLASLAGMQIRIEKPKYHPASLRRRFIVQNKDDGSPQRDDSNTRYIFSKIGFKALSELKRCIDLLHSKDNLPPLHPLFGQKTWQILGNILKIGGHSKSQYDLAQKVEDVAKALPASWYFRFSSIGPERAWIKTARLRKKTIMSLYR
jgi:hypothetical protein